MEITSISCPVCSCNRLIDKNNNTKSELYDMARLPVGWLPDYVQKCHKCGSQIGIKKVS